MCLFPAKSAQVRYKTARSYRSAAVNHTATSICCDFRLGPIAVLMPACSIGQPLAEAALVQQLARYLLTFPVGWMNDILSYEGSSGRGYADAIQ